MAIFASKISGEFRELTITQQTDTFTLDSQTIADGKVQLTAQPREDKKVRAWIQTSSGNLYPELQNYHLIATGADFDIIEQNENYFFRFDAETLTSTMPSAGSTLTVFYEFETQGDEVITDPQEIAQAVWQTSIASQYASEIMRRIYQINSGAWKLDAETRRLKFYDSDGTTVLFEFDMLDAQGNPTVSSVFERRPRT